MAASDHFEIKITGKGAHAAMPHLGVDSVLVTAQIVSALQSVTSRNTDPMDAVVVTVTQIHAGDTWNVIPADGILRGTVRSFDAKVRDETIAAMKRVARGICDAHGAEMDFWVGEGYPATVNHDAEADHAAMIAEKVVGRESVLRDAKPSMGAEDFAFMLERIPGAYIWLGAGEDSASLHNPNFDFNDEILPIGARYWTTLVEETLSA